MTVIDADGHVEESLAIFNFLEKEYYPRRPLVLKFDTDTSYGINNAVWFIEGQTFPRMFGRNGVIFSTPTPKIAFLEAGSEWLPYAVHQLKRGRKVTRNAAEYFREGRAFIGCESDEDINYLVNLIGEDAALAASDYPHTDPSQEENLVADFMRREDLPLRLKEKILSKNPKRLYKL